MASEWVHDVDIVSDISELYCTSVVRVSYECCKSVVGVAYPGGSTCMPVFLNSCVPHRDPLKSTDVANKVTSRRTRCPDLLLTKHSSGNGSVRPSVELGRLRSLARKLVSWPVLFLALRTAKYRTHVVALAHRDLPRLQHSTTLTCNTCNSSVSLIQDAKLGVCPTHLVTLHPPHRFMSSTFALSSVLQFAQLALSGYTSPGGLEIGGGCGPMVPLCARLMRSCAALRAAWQAGLSMLHTWCICFGNIQEAE